ncbi:unnamed protein product, partial [Meganyctiphanes norvegica]
MRNSKVYHIFVFLLIICLLVSFKYTIGLFLNYIISNGKIERTFIFPSPANKHNFRMIRHSELKFNRYSTNKSEAIGTKFKHTTSLLNNNNSRHQKVKDFPSAVVLWTQWRSGSSFFGELLHGAHQNTFYNYEPMIPLRHVKIFRDDNKETRHAISYLNSVLRCDMNTYQKISLDLS